MDRVTANPTRADDMDRPVGMIGMAVAMLLLPLGDAISKTLTEIATPFEVTAWRTFAQAVLFLPVALILRQRLRGTILSGASLLSAALILVTMLCLISAFAVMPIATAIAIFFVEPLLLTLLAGPFLGEMPGPRRFAAVAVGLIGALIVIRPNFAAFGPVALLPIVAALAYALNMIVMRKATRTRSALSFQFGATLCAAGLMIVGQLGLHAAGVGLTDIGTLPGWVAWWVFGAAVLVTLAFLMITFAFSKLEASHLAPLQYLEIVGATIVGYLVFGDIPDALTVLGTAIILASGIYVFHRERRQNVKVSAARPDRR